MQKNLYYAPPVKNEPVLTYKKGSPEREKLVKAIEKARSEVADIPMIIDGKEVRTGKIAEIHPPHDHQHLLGYYHKGDESHVKAAIDAALRARESWSEMSWKQRASIFLRAAGMIAGPYRARINAATMLGQSKSVHQAEIDSACELVDFLRFNVQYMTEIYNEQPDSDELRWNRLEQRALEGFVFALTPFNFTAIAGNLPSAPAMMGNTVVWKPSNAQIYSARIIMEVFMEAGLPDGVINLVFVSGPVAGKVIFLHPEFAGIHFTGSTSVFGNIWKEIGTNISKYRSYPRIVGETGGKNFVLVHQSANAAQVATALTRGAFEYQGQKCSAVSRAYIPDNLWEAVLAEIKCDMDTMKMGPAEDFSNFMNAVIDESSFDKTSIYALTGSVFSKNRYAIEFAMKKLKNAAGNFYINDKPTGAVVNQQPFGGARGSGTNDKAGSKLNLMRWVSPRTIKECFLPPESYKYPFLED